MTVKAFFCWTCFDRIILPYYLSAVLPTIDAGLMRRREADEAVCRYCDGEATIEQLQPEPR